MVLPQLSIVEMSSPIPWTAPPINGLTPLSFSPRVPSPKLRASTGPKNIINIPLNLEPNFPAIPATREKALDKADTIVEPISPSVPPRKMPILPKLRITSSINSGNDFNPPAAICPTLPNRFSSTSANV